ncbi:MFS transporter [Alteromonas lipolytica]|uniref:Transporter n=1 Tax=Alteromonas lipolytica TaxID=1856405 RepID=A0A1E8F8N3_9ALTE|nr:MFS transporter [Alteromonas lipolytica]OFI32272.1 transporter [Alteromonas lipolytica]GGF85897.1 hypothetical protein GCM10011338_42790 [Alteromonas lipolytica]
MHAELPTHRFYVIVLTFILLSVLGQISTSIYTPFFADLADGFNTSLRIIEKSVATFLLAFSISQLLSGMGCDYLKKHTFLVVGLLVFIVGSLLAATAQTESQFLLGRIVQGLGGGVGVSVTRALSTQLFSEQQLTISLSLTNVAFGIAPAVSPVIGTVIGHYFGLSALFYFVALLAFLTLLLLIFSLFTVRQVAPTQQNVFGETLGLIRSVFNKILLVGVASGLLYGIVFCFVTVAPAIILGQHQQSKTVFSVYSLLATACFVAGSLVNIRLVASSVISKFSVSCLLIFMLSALQFITIGYFNVTTLPLLLCFSYVMFFVIGVAMPCSVSIMLGFSKTSAGFLAALVGFFHLTGASLGAYLVAEQTNDPTQSFALVTGLLGVGSLIASRLMGSKHEEQKTDNGGR